MATEAAITFPAPIGGWPIPLDFAPSILFACVYVTLLCVAIYRVSKPHSRNLVVCLLLADLSERIALWSLRAWVSKTPSESASRGIMVYFQVAFSAGYLSVWGKLIILLRSIVVNTTKGTTFTDAAGSLPEERPSQSNSEIPMLNLREERRSQVEDIAVLAHEYGKPVQLEDQPRTRALYRKVFDIINPLQFIPVILGPIMGNWYVDAETEASKAKAVSAMRYVNAGSGITLVGVFHLIVIFALFHARGIRRGPVLYLYVIVAILEIVPIYQLVIVKDTTTSILSREPGSQNTPGEKACFYVLQVVPEVVCAASLLVINTKTMFGTGTWGDADFSKLKKLFSRRRAAA